MVANRKGLAKFLKYCWKYWREAEPARLQREAELIAQKKKADDELKRMGVSV
jgi:hypothetical protein